MLSCSVCACHIFVLVEFVKLLMVMGGGYLPSCNAAEKRKFDDDKCNHYYYSNHQNHVNYENVPSDFEF